MPELSPPSPAVVVGIDGSRSAVDAALWAVDEAVDRDLPMRLLYAIEPPASPAPDCQSITHDFVTAEAAIRFASMAVESLDRPVKIDVEIVHGRCVDALATASHSAAIVCVGARGMDDSSQLRVGSTALELVARAFCPVAVVRQPTLPPSATHDIAVVFDGSAEGFAVLECALKEARLRSAPLRVGVARRPTFPEIQDTCAGAMANRSAKADLELSLASSRARYPDIDVQAVAVAGNPVNYLARHVDSIGLIVLGRDTHDESIEFSWPTTHAPWRDVNCSVLICEPYGAS
jgi:nucleotide-binding universal stress UspA family protein